MEGNGQPPDVAEECRYAMTQYSAPVEGEGLQPVVAEDCQYAMPQCSAPMEGDGLQPDVGEDGRVATPQCSGTEAGSVNLPPPLSPNIPDMTNQVRILLLSRVLAPHWLPACTLPSWHTAAACR